MLNARCSRTRNESIRHWALGFGLLALCLALASCAGEAPTPPGVLVVGVRLGPNNLDPRFASDLASQRVNQLIFNSLMDFAPDLRVTGVLAERLDNPDPLTYIASLRRGVKWHDGRDFTARDVVYTYSGYIDPKSTSPFKGAFRMLQSVRAIDDYTVEFKLKTPFAAFPIQLVTPPVIPEGAGTDFNRKLVGTGPYRFVRYDVDDKVVLEPFAQHFQGAPRNAGIVIRVIPDDTMRGLEIRKRAIDVVMDDMPPDIVHQLREDADVTVAEAPGLDYTYISNNTRDPILRDRRVRQALAYAVDANAIVEYLRRGIARQATGLLASQGWAYDPTVTRYAHDPARAKSLLDEAGYPDPDGDGPRMRFRVSLKVSTAEEFRMQAAVIQQDLREVGVDLDVQSLEFATMFADVVKGNFQLVQMQWAGGATIDPDIVRRVFHSQQTPENGGFNRGRYSNAEVDRLLDLATESTDEAERKKYYGEAQKLIAEDAPYISLWNRTNVAIGLPTLDGLKVTTTGSFTPLKDVAKQVGR